jgi:hypothetical protein
LLLVGPPLPDRLKESTQTKKDALVLQVGGWVDGPAPHHPEKKTQAKKPHVQRMAEGRLPKIALRWMPKQKRARERPKKTGWKR